jgi:hypothetical protein
MVLAAAQRAASARMRRKSFIRLQTPPVSENLIRATGYLEIGGTHGVEP